MKPEHVLKAITDFYGISVKQILSSSRATPIPEARQMACFILKDMPRAQVAIELNIDRSAVYYHTERMSFFLSIYDEFNEKHLEILTKINEYHDNQVNA